jgi:hypothetical protein
MKTNHYWLTVVLLSSLLVGPLWAAEDEDKKKEEDEKPKTIAEFTKDADRIDGLFTLFRDKKTGETSMLIKRDQLDKEYIYWMQVANGVVDAGFFKGAYGPSGIIELHRSFNKVEFIEKNTAFYFDPNNAISRAASANISDAVLAVEEIVAKDEASGDILIKIDKVFATEALAQIKPTPDPDADPKTTFTLGELNGDKTRIMNLRSYPANTDIEVEYVYNNPAPTVQGKAAVTDSRNVSIRVMHSLIEVPENDYQPRRDDPRIGYFGEQITDLTSTQAAPYRDLISRWNLVKKQPGAAMSEPVEPITWWIENTTPVEWRELIRTAALEWNNSFEKIGFKDAVVVKVQPDDADWDAGDIRYNVLRWTSSPNPPFGGYGPSFTNPRTGQIIGADVMLEYSFMTRLTRTRRNIQDPAGTPEMPSAMAYPNFDASFCALGQGLAMNNTFANAAAAVYGFTDELDQQLARDTMHYLILHEMGHTLGMNHNMKATQLLSPEEAWDKDAVTDGILAASVMDYPAVNFAPTREQQTLFYTIAPGPYDDWFIEYGYSEGLADPVAEQQRLDAILARSTDPLLIFGNDADDMRSPGSGMDPRVNIYDMSSDAVTYASRQMDIMQTTLNGLPSKLPAAGQSYQETFEAVSAIMNLWGRSASVTSRYVGGVYVDRAMVGQAGGGQPFTPVKESRQRQAMEVLAAQVFAPDAFQVSPELLRITAPQRRGFDHFGKPEDPKIHDTVLTIQKGVLDHLMNPVVLKRISDSALYGNSYTLGEVFNDTTNSIFAADAKTNVNSYRRNLQTEYVTRLAKMAKGEGYDTGAIAMSVYSLNRIDALLGGKRNTDVETQAHVQNLQLIIERALSADA